MLHLAILSYLDVAHAHTDVACSSIRYAVSNHAQLTHTDYRLYSAAPTGDSDVLCTGIKCIVYFDSASAFQVKSKYNRGLGSLYEINELRLCFDEDVN
jgi:hypothetical protein